MKKLLSQQIPGSFRSDGCSGVPDQIYLKACKIHDARYRGEMRGRIKTRTGADREFYYNMVALNHQWLREQRQRVDQDLPQKGNLWQSVLKKAALADVEMRYWLRWSWQPTVWWLGVRMIGWAFWK